VVKVVVPVKQVHREEHKAPEEKPELPELPVMPEHNLMLFCNKFKKVTL
jgi:hypothetical protein